MTPTVHTTRVATDPIPGQRRATGASTQPTAPAGSLATGLAAARRAFQVARGLRSLRPVPARQQEPYGECDGQ